MAQVTRVQSTQSQRSAAPSSSTVSQAPRPRGPAPVLNCVHLCEYALQTASVVEYAGNGSRTLLPIPSGAAAASLSAALVAIPPPLPPQHVVPPNVASASLPPGGGQVSRVPSSSSSAAVSRTRSATSGVEAVGAEGSQLLPPAAVSLLSTQDGGAPSRLDDATAFATVLYDQATAATTTAGPTSGAASAVDHTAGRLAAAASAKKAPLHALALLHGPQKEPLVVLDLLRLYSAELVTMPKSSGGDSDVSSTDPLLQALEGELPPLASVQAHASTFQTLCSSSPVAEDSGICLRLVFSHHSGPMVAGPANAPLPAPPRQTVVLLHFGSLRVTQNSLEDVAASDTAATQASSSPATTPAKDHCLPFMGMPRGQRGNDPAPPPPVVAFGTDISTAAALSAERLQPAVLRSGPAPVAMAPRLLPMVVASLLSPRPFVASMGAANPERVAASEAVCAMLQSFAKSDASGATGVASGLATMLAFLQHLILMTTFHGTNVSAIPAVDRLRRHYEPLVECLHTLSVVQREALASRAPEMANLAEDEDGQRAMVLVDEMDAREALQAFADDLDDLLAAAAEEEAEAAARLAALAEALLEEEAAARAALEDAADDALDDFADMAQVEHTKIYWRCAIDECRAAEINTRVALWAHEKQLRSLLCYRMQKMLLDAFREQRRREFEGQHRAAYQLQLQAMKDIASADERVQQLDFVRATLQQRLSTIEERFLQGHHAQQLAAMVTQICDTHGPRGKSSMRKHTDI